ncbi:MAG: G5 domain-containing protein [Anaerolineae bacterium]|nr:G5 domain-containing protein [Anaerolineae bacterium]
MRRFWLFLILSVVLAGCQFGEQPANEIRVRVLVDGKQLALTTTDPLTVRQLLERNNISRGDLDRIDPDDFKLVEDNMTITIVRVRDETTCETQDVPYGNKELPTYDLKPAETRVMQAGAAGQARVCFNILYEDNVEKSRTQTSYTVTTEPQPQIVAVGIDNSPLEPREIPGLIAYLSGGQGYYIDGNTKKQGKLPTGENLDGKVFALSPDGRQLLYTRHKADASSDLSSPCNDANELWILLNTRDPNAEPVKIETLFNVRTADWVPNQQNVFSYSTFTPRPAIPCLTALNDLILARVDPVSGGLMTATPVVPTNPMGQYGSWGMNYAWAPEGNALAWANAESLGLVDLQKGEYVAMLTFPVFSTTLSQGWLWKPMLSWTADGAFLTATIHGKPYDNLPAETSPIFDIVLIQAGNVFQINPAVEQTGMWSTPRYSYLFRLGSDSALQGYQAFLKARTPLNSISSEYDIVIADRDGSNERVLFPGTGREGIKPINKSINDNSDFVWSPDVRQIAVVYQGDLYLVDVSTGNATRATLVGNVALPRWAK